jgi:putative phage-type endonuclease
MEQRSEEWFQARLGKVTASRVADIVAKTKSGYSTSRANYMAELVCERLTNSRGASFTNSAIQWGVDNEPLAVKSYEASRGVLVEQVGFIPHPLLANSGASPDGYVGDEGLIEVKCPLTSTHIDTILTNVIPNRYYHQMQWQMACTRRQWCDYISFDPRMPQNMQLHVQRVQRDQNVILELETEVAKFLVEVEVKVMELKNKFGE